MRTKAETAAYTKQWALDHKEQRQEQAALYRERHRSQLAEKAHIAYQSKTTAERQALAACHRDYNKTYRKRNKEHLAARAKENNARNKTQIAAKKAVYYQENRAVLLDAVKKRYKANPEPVKERVAKWQKANPERVRELNRASAHRHPETGKRGWHARRARLAGAPKVVNIDRLKVFERDGWICQICRKPIDREARPKSSLSASVDHIVPLAAEGAHTYENCQATHFGCNARKRDKVNNHATDSEPTTVGD